MTNDQYGITEASIGGYSTWGTPSEVTEICRCPQVSNGAGGWRCAGGRNCEPKP